MSDSEDDIFSMSTVPYDTSDSSSIYEKETQALDEISMELISCSYEKNPKKEKKCQSYTEVELYDGPTQPLIVTSNSRHKSLPAATIRALTPERNDADSDCDTLPASPKFNQDQFSGDEQGRPSVKDKSPCLNSSTSTDDEQTQPLMLPQINAEEENSSRPTSAMSLGDEPTQRLFIQGSDEKALSSPILLLSPVATRTSPEEPREQCYSPEIPLYDGPTQPLLATDLFSSAKQQEKAGCSKDGSNSSTLRMSSLRYSESNQESLTAKMRASQTSDMDIEEDDDDVEPTQLLCVSSSNSPEKHGAPNSTIAEEEVDSDRETLPSSPVLHLDSKEELPSTQSLEPIEPIPCTVACTALKTVDNWDSDAVDACPLSPDLFSACSPCPETNQVHNSTLKSETEDNNDENDTTTRLDHSKNADAMDVARDSLQPNSPVFDFDESVNEVVDSSRAATPEFSFQESQPFVPETPYVNTNETSMVSKAPFVAETPFSKDPPSAGDESLKIKKKIIRRSAKAEASSPAVQRTSTPEDMVLESSQEKDQLDDNTGCDTGDSDFELSFASHYSALPVPASSVQSSDPFVGFEADEIAETTNHLQIIQQVINDDQADLNDENNAFAKSSAPLVPSVESLDLVPAHIDPPPPPPPPSTAVPKPLPAPRRSSRKPVPNTRRTCDLSEASTVTTDKVERRRPGRPRKNAAANETVKTEIESSEESDTSRKAVSVSVLHATTSVDSTDEDRLKGNRRRVVRQTRGGQKQMSLPNPCPETPPAKARARRQVKKEMLNQSVAESDAEPQPSVSLQRRSKQSVNNNTDTSSVGSNSPAGDNSRRRKRALAGQVRILFTVIDIDSDREIVQRLGGRVVTTFKDCSVLVTDRIRRTVKFLCCVGLGLPIVGREWLAKCHSSGKFVDPWLHLLRDEEGETKFNFKLSESLRIASETPLLAGWIFHTTPSVMPPPSEMQEIVEACGGFYVEEIDDKSVDNKVVISCLDDKKMWRQWAKRAVTLIDKEAVLIGVLQQSFEPDKFKLTA